MAGVHAILYVRMPAHFEPYIRAAVFLLVLGLLLGWQKLAPRNKQPAPGGRRISANVFLALLNAGLVRVIAPLGLTGWALAIQGKGWGLLNAQAAGWPGWLRIGIALLVLDLVVYAQHVMFHKSPLLWRFHKVHHADIVLDVTTGIRFHPGEILFSLGLKGGVLLVLGAPPVAVIIFEVLLNATALFNHTNGAMLPRLDRFLRWGVVTPDMHRIHHSTRRDEFNTNFGFNLPWWDHLFGTYKHASAEPLESMEIGMAEHRASLPLGRLLQLPFVTQS